MRASVVRGLVAGVAVAGMASYGCATSPVDETPDASGAGYVPADSGTGSDGSSSFADSGVRPATDSGSSGEGGLPPPGDSGSANEGGQANDSGMAGDTGFGPGDSGGPTDSGSPADTGSPGDSGSCVVAISSQGPFDAGSCPAPVSNTCGPGSLSGFTGAWKPPTGAHQNLCTPAEISQIYTDCLDPNNSDPLFCSLDQSSYPACYGCLFTADTSSSWGPIVLQSNGLVDVNISGCIALVEPCNLACAKAFESQYQCELASCETNCQVTDQASENAYTACIATADKCGCQAYFDPGQCETKITGSHPAAQCTSAPDFATFYDYVAPLFCGQ